MKPLFLALAMAAVGSGYVHAEDSPDASFAKSMQGCWNRTSWPAHIEVALKDPKFLVSTQLCFEGDTSGSVTSFHCHGYGTLDCWDDATDYAFEDDKLWLGRRGEPVGLQACDVQLVLEKKFKISNCGWAQAGSRGFLFDDAVYERVVS